MSDHRTTDTERWMDEAESVLNQSIPAIAMHARGFSQEALIRACDLVGSKPEDWTSHPDVLEGRRESLAMDGWQPIGRRPSAQAALPLPKSVCPRCAALTRERDEMTGVADNFRQALMLECERSLALSRDLAQARQALHHVLDEAIDIWHERAPGGFPLHEWLGLTPDEYAAFVELRMDDLCALIVAREALVERGTEKTDTGDEPRSSCAGEPRELVCQICGVEHGVWFAPSAIWNAVCREGDRGNPDKWSFLCPVCFMREGDKLGLAPTGWFLTPEPWDDDKRRALGLPVEEPAHVSGCELPTPAPVSLSVQEGQGEALGASGRRAQEGSDV